MRQLFKFRQDGDYDVTPITEEDAEAAFAAAVRVVDLMKHYLKGGERGLQNW